MRTLQRRLRRTTCWVFCAALVVLHPIPGKTLYHCLVTGEYLDECCCEAPTSCCEELAASPCCEQSDVANAEPATDLVGAASCGCCHLVYRDETRLVAPNVQQRDETGRKKSDVPAPFPATPRVTTKTGKPWEVSHRAPPLPRKVPLYLLHASLRL